MRVVVTLSLALVARVASAQDDASVAQARAAYDRGAAAYDAGGYATAAVDLALADELSPNVTVLGLALEAAVRARDAATAMDLVERVERRVPPSTPLWEKGKTARARFSRDVGQLTVTCPPPATFCNVHVDGRHTPIGVKRWVKPGEHVVELTADGAPEKQKVVVAIGASVEVAPTPPPAPAPPPSKIAPPPARAIEPPRTVAPSPPRAPHDPPRRDGGISPVWFWVGAAVTAVVGGVTVWSALDTKSKHDDFVAKPSAPTSTAGSDAQVRTNVLALVTAASGAATAAVGLFAIGWSTGPGPAPTVTATLSARF